MAAGITDSLISTIAQAFVYDFNFQTEINPGDIFEAAFEQKINKSGEAVGPPRLLYASITTSTKSKAVYRFQPPDGEEGWFDGNGRTVKRSFMRTPVEGARITSHFGMRFHPVLHYTRLHGGIDLAAPIGTPIYAAAVGTVTSASFSACGGNMVILQHDKGMETRYLHMEHFADGLMPGEPVRQGQEIGVIGVTGSCTTGPPSPLRDLDQRRESRSGEHTDRAGRSAERTSAQGLPDRARPDRRRAGAPPGGRARSSAAPP